MTTETMREAVARAICRAGGLCVGFCHAQRCATARKLHGDEADAAIRTVLERLREPTPSMKSAFTVRAIRVSIGGDYTWYDYARDQWQAMLDAAVREVG